MPSMTERQRRAAGAALAIQRGEKSGGRGPSAKMASSMSEKQLRDFAKKSPPRKSK